MRCHHLARGMGGCICLAILAATLPAEEPKTPLRITNKLGLYEPITEPPCSYCSTQHRKKFIEPDDRVLAWIRASHNGGAISIRHFLSAPRVINDTYGLFFYDPDGGYVAAFQKDYGYKFYGWRGGVMVAQGRDGTLWWALTGEALEGPQKGKRLTRIPSLLTTWENWLMLHPESTAYDMFDGKKYKTAPLPTEVSADAKASMGEIDRRLPAMQEVCGIEVGNGRYAVPLDPQEERACYLTNVEDQPVAVFWYGPTKTAVAFSRKLDDKLLTLYADDISPETAPFKDKETGTRWTIAGRGVDGPLKGKELRWVDSIQCRWYAWSTCNPKSVVHDASSK